MKDPILEKLKQNKRTIPTPQKGIIKRDLPMRVYSQQPAVPIQIINPELYQPKTDISLNPINECYIRPGDLKELIYQINKNQGQLNKIILIENSALFRTLEFFYTKFSKKANLHKDIYEVFKDQQIIVNELNQNLITMRDHYTTELKNADATLEDIVSTTEQHTNIKKQLESGVLEEQKRRCKEVSDKFNKLTDKDPNYYQNFLEAFREERIMKDLNYKKRIVDIGTTHSKRDIENLYSQIKIFETTLHNVGELAYLTARYQQTLNYNAPLWEAAKNLAEAVRSVSGGVRSLQDFNEKLNNQYIRSISAIAEATRNPPNRYLGRQNSQLRLLANRVERNHAR
ncbi:MAG: hypothetical protein PHE43_03895 [Candidatus Nanoarchaeia archaeon]|nr:hypothetical protein [Candidatus Nanoarchaeia archaeon]